TPMPDASASHIERRAKLALDSGTLEGKLTVTYTGLEASYRRLEERNEDDAERRQFLENEIAGVVPTGIDVKLTNSPDWGSTEDALVAEYQLRVPGWASGAGRRQLLPVGLFGNGERHTFEHSQRVHPICFDFPSVHLDDVTIDMPAGWQVERAPDPHLLDMKGMVYRAAAQNVHQSLHLTRELTTNLYLTGVASYPALQKFYQTVRAGDEEQTIITALSH
ncbi:MAG TPA: hypothetical protein VEY89_01020, partial [Candidatus Dormibacteraeota bacterium]|nr:hypothetical protein [Candidatus Dormibacteraeota bacterium]